MANSNIIIPKMGRILVLLEICHLTFSDSIDCVQCFTHAMFATITGIDLHIYVEITPCLISNKFRKIDRTVAFCLLANIVVNEWLHGIFPSTF